MSNTEYATGVTIIEVDKSLGFKEYVSLPASSGGSKARITVSLEAGLYISDMSDIPIRGKLEGDLTDVQASVTVMDNFNVSVTQPIVVNEDGTFDTAGKLDGSSLSGDRFGVTIGLFYDESTKFYVQNIDTTVLGTSKSDSVIYADNTFILLTDL